MSGLGLARAPPIAPEQARWLALNKVIYAEPLGIVKVMAAAVLGVSSDHDLLLSAVPVGRQDFEASQTPVFVNARREGRRVT